MSTIQKISPEALARALMHDVYHPITACVWLDSESRVSKLWLFDTAFCSAKQGTFAAGDTLLVISSHCDGDMWASEADVKNCAHIRESGAACRLLLYNEDEGLVEAKD